VRVSHQRALRNRKNGCASARVNAGGTKVDVDDFKQEPDQFLIEKAQQIRFEKKGSKFKPSHEVWKFETSLGMSGLMVSVSEVLRSCMIIS